VRPFFVTPGATGRVLASFDRSCYLESAEGRLIVVLCEPLGRGAFALTVGGTPSFAALQPDAPVSVVGGTLHLGDLRIDLSSAIPWDPTLPVLDRAGDEGLRVLATHLRANASSEGLARMRFDVAETPLLTAGRQAMDRLRLGFARGDGPAIIDAAAQLAGLGPGLTPSGDDVLTGILLALRVWPQASGPLGMSVVSTLLVRAAVPRTGRISRAYLWAAWQGHASEAWHDLIRALPGESDGVVAAATRILQTGETSGADMLAGFLSARRR
jgi:hypothetical protein